MRPASLYVGETWHRRFGPRPHEFRYRLFQLLVDVDRLDEGLGGLKLMRRGRRGVMSFDPRDHGDRASLDLRPWVLEQLGGAGLETEARTIRLLCFPRVLGFVFNPLSVFFVHDAADRLEAVIYEVNNTFGQTHAYVVPAVTAERQAQRATKHLYVSPFYKVEGEYRFDIAAPGEAFDMKIVKAVDGKPDFVATQTATREALTDQRLAALFWSIPLMTLKVVAAIHWEALRLWIKGAPFGARPPGPKAGMSTGESVGFAQSENSDKLEQNQRSEHERDRRKRPLVRLGSA
jgi:uncharacterized protein